MREIQAANAKTHLPQLLDAVERGETIVITRHGRLVARLIPDAGNRIARAAQAIDRIKGLRSRKERITIDELLSARVLDASVFACWAFDDEDLPMAALALERLRTDEAHAPILWWYEMRNIVVNERRGRLTREDATTFCVAWANSAFPITMHRMNRACCSLPTPRG